MSARDMLTKIASTQLESGYPYIVNKTNANRVHALKDIGQIKMSNLCTEIFQLQETSEINDYGIEDIIRRDISCNLASLNIVNVMEQRKVKDSVHVGIEALTVVSDLSKIENAPGVQRANRELHSVGLGAMNLNGYLAKNKIAYESAEAREFASTFFMMMNFYSIEKAWRSPATAARHSKISKNPNTPKALTSTSISRRTSVRRPNAFRSCLKASKSQLRRIGPA